MKILDENIDKDFFKLEKVYLRPADLGEIYIEPIQAVMYTLV